MQVPRPKTNRRSDEDILEIVRAASEKYNQMGAVPILPLTEDEFDRLHKIVRSAVNND